MKPAILRLKAGLLESIRSINGRLQAHKRTGPGQRVGAIPFRKLSCLKVDGIGDFVLSTTFLNMVRERAPEADVTLICTDLTSAFARQLYPEWKIVSFPWLTQGRIGLWPRRTPVRRMLEDLPSADLLVDLRTTRFCHDAVLASWVPARAKLALKNQNRLKWTHYPNEAEIYDSLPEADLLPQGENICRDIQNYRSLLHMVFPDFREAGTALPSLPDFPDLWKAMAEKLPEPADKLIVCPFSGGTIKEYPTSLLAEAIGQFAHEAGFIPCVLGGKDCRDRGRDFCDLLGRYGKCENLVGRLSLAETCCYFRRARAVLAMDTGLAHMAIASGTPSVVILGGGSFGQFAPWGEAGHVRWLSRDLPCFGCNWHCHFEVPRCIHEISVREIHDALRDVLSGRMESASSLRCTNAIDAQ